MLELLLDRPETGPLRVLLLGAHCDDIEIGCGGTVLALASRVPELAVHWVVLSSNDARAREAETCARRFLAGVGRAEVVVERFRDGYFPYDGGRIKDFFEELKASVVPDVIFTHQHDDWHQDHRLVCELSWNTWRNHLILEYEIPKYDPDTGAPNAFVRLDAATAERKVELILEGYPTQAGRHWFTRDTFLGLMRLRGIQSCAAPYAEAFYGRKMVLAGRGAG
jgi:LmbE family N-acetylglucosaminyl deacetylase